MLRLARVWMCGGQSNEKLLCFLSCGGFPHLHREKKAKNAPGFTTMEMDHQGSLLPLCVLQIFRAGLWMCKWALESQSLLITNQNIASHQNLSDWSKFNQSGSMYTWNPTWSHGIWKSKVFPLKALCSTLYHFSCAHYISHVYWTH